MKKHLRRFTAFLVAIVAVAACVSPIRIDETQPSSSDQVATIVAMTLQAFAPEVANTPTSLLPHSLYFLGRDSQSLSQVYRMEQDGKTKTQLTFEPVNVTDYDVSVVDGSIAYMTSNQLLLANEDGSNPRVLVDGGPVDPNNRMTSLHHPVFSPDGQTIAYAHNGLNLHNMATGVSKLVLQAEFYRPEKYSPDGLKLLMTISVPNTDATHDVIYYPTTNSIVRFNSADGGFFCCGEEEWTQDSLSFYAANPTVGMLSPGLWKVDAASGTVTTLLPANAPNGYFNLADGPYLAPDGQLYYFFLESKNMIDGTDSGAPLQLVRSAPDGVTGRTVLRPETFETLNQALWAPDASFVITAKAPADSIYADGVIELYYTDATKGMISLPAFGQQLKWGP